MSVRGTGIKYPPFPTFQAAAHLNQAAAVQNTWYTVLNTTTNVRVLLCVVTMSTAAEDLEMRVTIDGQVLLGAQAAAVAGTKYYCYINDTPATPAQYLTVSTGVYNIANMSSLDCKSFKFEVRKTSANGANQLNGGVVYQRW